MLPQTLMKLAKEIYDKKSLNIRSIISQFSSIWFMYIMLWNPLRSWLTDRFDDYSSVLQYVYKLNKSKRENQCVYWICGMFMPIKLRPGGMLFFINSFCRLGLLSDYRIIGFCSIAVHRVKCVFLNSACRFIICSLIRGEKMLCLWSGWKSEFRQQVVIVERWVFTGLGTFMIELRLELPINSIYYLV